MYLACSAQKKPPYTASTAPFTARGHTDAPARCMLQHAPAHTRAPSPQHAPHAPCIPLAAHRRNRHTQPARLHPPQGGTPTLRHGACFSTHQHTPTRSNPASSIVSTTRAPRPMLPEKPATRARHKLRHRSRDTLQPIRPRRPAARTHRRLRLRLGPARRAAQPQHHKPPPRLPPQDPAIRTQKKVRPFDLTLKRRLPTLPRENRSTIGVSELNFSVRNGKRWNLTAITT